MGRSTDSHLLWLVFRTWRFIHSLQLDVFWLVGDLQVEVQNLLDHLLGVRSLYIVI